MLGWVVWNDIWNVRMKWNGTWWNVLHSHYIQSSYFSFTQFEGKGWYNNSNNTNNTTNNKNKDYYSIHFPNNEIETFTPLYHNNGIEILVHKFIPFHQSLAIYSPKHSLGIFTNLLQYSTATLYYCPLFGFSLSFQPIAANQHFYTL